MIINSDIATPFYLVDEARIVDSVKSIREALARNWPNNVLAYSVKTNSLPCVLRVLSSLNVCAEVVSEYEYGLAAKYGFQMSQAVCNGPYKSQAFLSQAIVDGATINIDSLSEAITLMDLIKKKGTSIRIGIRLNANDAVDTGEMLCGEEGSRFGISEKDGELVELLRLVRDGGAVLSTLHLHCNTRGRKKENFARLAEYFADVAGRHGLKNVDTFDIGGSFGHDFDNPGDGKGRWPSWNEYFSLISSTLKKRGFTPDGLRLIIEPGSSLISNAADYYTTCIGAKKISGLTMMQIDGSRIHVDPHFARKSFHGSVSVESSKGSNQESRLEVSALLGCTCLEKDRIVFAGNTLKCAVGDRLLFDKTGAYTYGLTPILFIRPAADIYFRDLKGNVAAVDAIRGF